MGWASEKNGKGKTTTKNVKSHGTRKMTEEDHRKDGLIKCRKTYKKGDTTGKN